MPPPIPPRCRGARCGGNAPAHPHGPLGPGVRHFGRRPSAFGWPGVVGNRPGAPHVPPGVPPPVRPPGVPVRPPPIILPPNSSPIHPPAPAAPNYPPSAYPPSYPPPAYPPSYPPPGYPPSYPPAGYSQPPSLPSADPQEYPPIDPMASGGYADPSWGYADDGALPFDPSLLEPGSPAWDLWQGLMTGYLDTRNAAASASGESFPETSVGDVRKASLALSRELCLPRYDFADLASTRAAWRDALARIDGLCAGLSWAAPYPENERFWLSDSLALAQRLAAIDARRNGIELNERGSLALIGDHSDPLDLWQDLRHFFLARRLVRRGTKAVRGGEGVRYPETTVRDVAQVTQTLGSASAHAVPLLRAQPELRTHYEALARSWWEVLDRVSQHSKGRSNNDAYPDNEAFWLRDTKRVAIKLSTLRSTARPGAYRFGSPGGAS